MHSQLLPVWIALGAVLGAVSRYYLTLFCTQKISGYFPAGTFIVNLSGACLIGFAATVLPSGTHIPFNSLILTGFLGSYTTFSTYALETSNLVRQGIYGQALLYGMGSPAVGFLGVEVGIALARQL
ncbi:fluoride efflux transporter CrcB [filamentous cyanobacterium CCT1]|nr:fluoride efflux transporter CrcB [filamentous cyanobacterium CCT1]PSN78394.1 fluoride efflux transporter CrcB [filamentous cyanobacterium CCP4]